MGDDSNTQFDFWLGEWDLTWGEDGKGTNVIDRVMDSKIIQENFDGTPAIKLVGKSWSVYHHHEKKWKQTWVDNQGSYLDFSGEFKDGKMILVRDGYRNDGTPVKQRMVWYNIRDDEFDWNWEGSEDEGKTWDVLWQIHYKRKK